MHSYDALGANCSHLKPSSDPAKGEIAESESFPRGRNPVKPGDFPASRRRFHSVSDKPFTLLLGRFITPL